MFAIMDCVMFTDSHSHIQFAKEFPDIGEIIQRAEAAGVTRQVIVGCTPKDSRIAVEFANKHQESGFWAAIGVHPHDANLLTDEVLSDFRGLAKKERKVVAIGEIGLDYYRNFQPKETQIRAFRLQLKLARELGLAAVIHVRDAWDEAIEIMNEEGNEKLQVYGIAPPNGKTGDHEYEGKPRNCPQCGSTETELISRYGATPCKASYKCLSCLEPFEYFKCF